MVRTMPVRSLATILAASLLLAGCARWEPRWSGPATFERACPLTRAPRVTDFAPAGVRGAYHFVIQGATDAQRAGFILRSARAGFRLMLMTVQMDSVDTMFGTGLAVLRDQHAVDKEFRAACRLGSGPIYLTHVRHNPAGQTGDVRLR